MTTTPPPIGDRLPNEFIAGVTGNEGVVIGRVIWPAQSDDEHQARDEVTQLLAEHNLTVTNLDPHRANGVVWVTCLFEGQLADVRRWLTEERIRRLWYPPLAPAASFPEPPRAAP